MPVARDLVAAAPEADAESRKTSGTEGCRLVVLRALHRHTEDIGLELREKIIAARAAIDA